MYKNLYHGYHDRDILLLWNGANSNQTSAYTHTYSTYIHIHTQTQ